MLDKYFDTRISHCGREMNRQTLFKTLCDQLREEEALLMRRFSIRLLNVAIVSTLLGDGIALPLLGLLARKRWFIRCFRAAAVTQGDEGGARYFLLAISKSEYEGRWYLRYFRHFSCAGTRHDAPAHVRRYAI